MTAPVLILRLAEDAEGEDAPLTPMERHRMCTATLCVCRRCGTPGVGTPGAFTKRRGQVRPVPTQEQEA